MRLAGAFSATLAAVAVEFQVAFAAPLEGREPEAMERLKEAQPLLARAAERAQDNAYVLGTDAYLTFLLGDVPRAAELLTQAVQVGGEDLRRAELASAQNNLLPVDEQFIRMIEGAAGTGGLAATP